MSRLPGQFQEPRIIVLLQKYYKQSKTGRELLEKENLWLWENTHMVITKPRFTEITSYM